MALFVPAFTRMMVGNKVEQSASNFKLGLETAQSQAVSARRYVAMFIPTEYVSADQRLKTYCDSGFRLAWVKKDGSSYRFAGWLPESSWRNPMDGAALTGVDSDLKEVSISGVTDDDLNALGSAENRKAAIFSPYGGVAGDTDLTFTFTEAKLSGTNGNKAVYDHPNADNTLTLGVKGITGRVTYQ